MTKAKHDVAREPEFDARTIVRDRVRSESVYLVPTPPGIRIKLNQNESPYDVPVELKSTLVNEIAAREWNRYPSEFADVLRSKLASQLDLAPSNLIIGNGSNELAHFLGLCLVEPGDNVVLLDPMFALFEKIVRLHEARPVSVVCDDSFCTDPDLVIDTVREVGAKLVVVASPNNPTGKAIEVSEIGRIAKAVEAIVLVDEAYHEFVNGPTATSLLSSSPNVLVMRTFSKTMGLAGLRIGYVVGEEGLIGELMKARLPFMVNHFSELVACALLDQHHLISERVKRLTTERESMLATLQQMPGVEEAVPSSTNFLIFRTGLDSSQLEALLAERGVLIRSVSGYDRLSNFVRVNVGLPDENKAFLSALKDVLLTFHRGQDDDDHGANS